MAKKSVGINTSSSADIAFLLLTFFLLTSSINSEQGIPRRLPPPQKAEQEVIADINKRNVLRVVVNFNDAIMVNGEIMEISQLTETAKEFFSNPYNNPTLAEKETKNIDNIGDFNVSKGVISLQNDQSTTYNMYVQVQNELQRAINELRDQASMNYFGKKYDNLDTALQKSIQKAIPANISEAKSNDLSGGH